MAPEPRAERPPLRRRRAAQVAGVAGGLADHLGMKPGWVRTAFVITAFLSGAGLLYYLWLWAFVPPAEPTAGERLALTRRIPVAWILLSAAIVLALAATGSLLGSARTAVWGTFAIAAALLAAVAALWAGFFDITDGERGPQHVRAVRVTATVLILTLVLMSLLSANTADSPVTTLGVGLAALLCLAVVYAPALIRRFDELSKDRVRRIREEERSEIAAHLHDSVLQTLALIQNRAGASTEVARIARAQERELRGWLYDGDQAADSDLPTDLRDYAAALELDYPVHIDVVAAGTSTERASGDLASAAREAMLNAARHAGGAVSVYIEGRPDAVEVFIRDRGPGFSLEHVPQDRLGVRQSIVGRMRRAGGSADVRPGLGGTEVRLRLARVDRQPPRAGQPAVVPVIAPEPVHTSEVTPT